MLGQAGKFVEFDEPSAPSYQRSQQRRSKFGDYDGHDRSHRSGSRLDEHQRGSSHSRSRHGNQSSSKFSAGPSEPISNQNFFKAKTEQSLGRKPVASVFKRKGASDQNQEQNKKSSLSSFAIIKQKFDLKKGELRTESDSTALGQQASGIGSFSQSASFEEPAAKDDPLDRFMD